MFKLPKLKYLIFFLIIFLSLLSSSRFIYAQESEKNNWLMFRKNCKHTGFNEKETKNISSNLLWSFQADSQIQSSSSLVDNMLFFKSFNGFLYSLDAKNGDLRWKKDTQSGSPSDSAPAIVKDDNEITIYTSGPCTNCNLIALNGLNGDLKWSVSFKKGLRNITPYEDKLLVSSDDWYIRSINRNNGEVLWATKLNDGITSSPGISNNKVFVGTWSGVLYALDLNNGSILWQFTAGGVLFSSPAIIDETLYVGSGTEKTYAIDINDGSLKWVSSLATDSVWGSPSIANGIIYISDLRGRIQALNALDGNLIWFFDTNSSPSSNYSSPSTANNVVYFGSSNKNIYAINALSGELLWQYSTGGAILSSPIIVDGIVFVGSADGKMYALGGEVATPTPTVNPTPISTPSPPGLIVEDIKQFLPPWNKDIYDHATNWTNNPSIERWGCALTSAVMILRFYNFNIWPNTLNNWLKNQSDGYLRNGLLNWLAISRYTLLNQSDNSPVLEYKRLPGDINLLKTELSSGKPTILKVPNHFIVAKNQIGSTFQINDPAYTNRNTLDSYGNSFEVLNSFTPSHTDLSYILLVVDSDFKINFFDSNNNKVENYFYEETPIKDTLSNKLSGKNINIFVYPKPQVGNYKIEIDGPVSFYTLDSYLYDNNGNVIQFSQKSLKSQNQEDIFNISYDNKNNTIEKKIDIYSILENFNTAYNLRLIKNKFLFKNIKFELLTVKNLSRTGRKLFIKKILNNILIQIKFNTPFFIEKNYSIILRDDIKKLINSF